MLELFLPWFLTTCISGILGNRTDAKFVSIVKNISEKVQVDKIVNNDMQKALNRSFILSLLSICGGCLNELKHEYPLQKGNFKLSGQLRWLETKKLSLEHELKAVEKAEYGEPKIELLDEIKFLLSQGDPTSEAFQKIKTELIERAEIGNDKAPECYNKSIERNILSQMCNHFACEIESNQALSNILEKQLLIQLGIKIDAVLASVPSMIQNLNYIPAMAYQVDTMARQVDIMAQAMPQMLERINSEKNSNAPCRIFQVPPLTEEFVEIPKKEEIKNYLLNSNKSRRILSITAIQGLGGIGKTTLATVLGHDEDVQNYFSDGILWAPLGQEPDKLSWLNNWIQALGDYQTIHTTTETASIHLRSLLCEKRILLVIDDAWNSSDVKPFLVGGSNCQTIITTRKAYIADDLSAESYPLNVMTEEQALELFRNVLKDCWDENEKENALKVAKDVGYLPLALNLAAKRRRGGYSWTKLHEALEEEISRLGVLESPRIFGKGEEGLEASLNLSLKALRSCNENVWKSFIWLGVLPEDVNINKKMVSTLWDIDTGETGEILDGLWGEGLLIPSSTINLGDEKLETYRMHDLFHDIALYYLTSSPDTKKATSLPGLGVKLQEAHTFLLNRYQSQTQKKGLWHTLKDDAYIHSHFTWHLEKAGKIEDIHSLLREENENCKNGWYEALESLGLNAVFIEDVIRAWNLSEKESIHQIEQGDKSSYIGLEIRYALIYTSLNSLSANISEELLIALLKTKKWTKDKVLIYAQKEPDLQTRAYKLISIYQETKDESIKNEKLMEKAYEIAFKIESETQMAEVLLAIFQYSDGQRKEEMMEKALNATSKIESNNDRGWVLSNMISSVIISNLDEQRKEEIMKKALNTIFKIEDNYVRAKVLSDVIPCLDGQRKEEVLEKALDATFKVKTDYERAKAFSDVIPYLDEQKKEEVMEKALDATSKIEDNGDRALVLLSIFPYLDERKKEEVLEKALDATLKIEDNYKRASLLSGIISNLDGHRENELKEKVIDVASKIKNNYKRAKSLLAIVPSLDWQRREEVIEKALDTSFMIEADYLRVEVLSAIVPNLDEQRKEEMMERALDVASKIKDNDDRARSLLSILPYLDGQRKEKVLEKALNAASKIENGHSQIWTFINTLPYLDEHRKKVLIEEILDSASKIKDDNERALALSSILPYLDGQRKEEVVEKALEANSKIEYEGDTLKALSEIIPYLDEQRKEKMLEKIIDEAPKLIKYDDEITWALVNILPYLDGQRKEEAMEKTLDAAFMMVFNEDRARVFHSMLSDLRNLPMNNLYLWWKKVIKVLRERTRSSLLIDITALILVVSDLGNDETLFEISQAIVDVSRWWP